MPLDHDGGHVLEKRRMCLQEWDLGPFNVNLEQIDSLVAEVPPPLLGEIDHRHFDFLDTAPDWYERIEFAGQGRGDIRGIEEEIGLVPGIVARDDTFKIVDTFQTVGT